MWRDDQTILVEIVKDCGERLHDPNVLGCQIFHFWQAESGDCELSRNFKYIETSK